MRKHGLVDTWSLAGDRREVPGGGRFAAGLHGRARHVDLTFGLEGLETRRLLALVSWDGGGDGSSWADPLNWSADMIPGAVDDVLIPGTPGGGALVLALAGMPSPVASLRAERGVRLMEGGLEVTGDARFEKGLGIDVTASLTAGLVRADGAIDGFVKIDGVLRAARIEIDAGADGVVAVRGEIDASSARDAGGWVELLGRQVVLIDARVDASGATAGGTVLVGGDQEGRGDLRRAEAVYVNGASVINARACDTGAGGRVVLWSDVFTGFFGTIIARGGGAGGDGGFVETSSVEKLQVAGSVDASASNGAPGAWLLDPRNISITAGGNDNVTFSGTDPVIVTATSTSGFVAVATLNSGLSAGTSVTIRTSGTGLVSGNITVSAAISKTGGGNATLRLEAANDIIINATITDTSLAVLNLVLIANDQAQGGDLDPSSGSVNVNAAINTGGGSVTITGVGAAIAAGVTATGGLTINAGTAGITFSGAVSTGGGTITLNSAGNVAQAGAGTLSTTAGIRFLGSGLYTLALSNALPVVAANLTGAGALTIGSTVSISVGAVSGTAGITTAGGSVVFSTGGAVTITQPVNAGAGVVAAEVAGVFSLSGAGSVTSGSFGVISSSAISIIGGVSATTVAFAGAGGPVPITYSQSGSFTAGQVLGLSGVASSGAAISLASTAGAVTLARAVNAGAGTLTIASASGISQTSSGGITAGALALSGTGSVSLDAASNNIGTLAASLTGSATLLFSDINALTIGTVGGVVGISTASRSVQIASGGLLSITSPMTSGSAQMFLLANDFNATATITCNSTLFLDLATPSGTIGLGGGAGSMQVSAADLSFINAEVLSIGGFTSFTTITTGALSLSTRPFALRLFGNTIATAGIIMNPLRALTLGATTASQTGAIIAGDLLLQLSSSSSLTHPANDVDRLGFQVGGTFVFTDVDGVQVGSQGTGGSLGEFTAVTLNAGGAVVLANSITAAAGSSLTMNASGGVSTTGGVITVNTARFTGGPVNLAGNNDADSLSFALTGASAFTWTDTDDLTVNTSSTAGGAVTLTVPVLSVLGTLSAGAGLITLVCATDCDTVESGQITATSLLVRGGNVDSTFTLSTNIVNLASDANATLLVTEANALTITTLAGIAGLSASNRDAGLTIGGSLSIQAPIDRGAAALTLTAAGATTQSGSGALNVQRLIVRSTGSTGLSAASNAVAILEATGAGAITLATTGALVVGNGLSEVQAAGLTIAGAAGITVASSIASTGGVSIHAGSDGTGNLTVNSGRAVRAPSILLRAGDGPGGGGNAGSVTTTGASFQGAAGGATSPGAFTIRQDASIADAAIPLATQFGAGIVGLPLGLQSEAGSITIATAAKVAGAGLTLSSATGSILNTSISPASLLVTGPATSAGGSVTATGNVTFAGPLTLNVSTTLTGTGVSLGLVDGNAAGLRALTINASGVTTFGGTVGGALALASVTTSAAGSVVFGASVFTTGAQTYNETALSLTAAAALSAGGDITFAPLSTLAAGANNLTLRANEITLGGDLTGTGALTIEAATAAQGITLGAVSAANLDLTTAELARIGAAFASVTIGRADGAGQIVVAGASTFSNPTALRVPQPGGSILVNAALVGIGDASFTFVGSGATTTLNADVRTAGAPITFNDSVLIGAASVTVDTTNNGAVPAGAGVTFSSVVDSEPGETNALTVLSGTGGATVFAAPIGSTRALASISTDAGGTLSIVGATTTGTQSFADAAANIRGSFATAGGGVTFSGAVTLGAATTLNPGTGPAFFGSTVNGAFTLQVNSSGATTFNAPVGASVPLASFTSDAPGTLLVSGIAVSGALQVRDSIITLSAGSTYSSSGGVIATTAGSSVRLLGNATIAAPAGFQATLAATIDALTPGVGALLVTGPAAVLGAIGGSTPLGSVRFTGQAGVSSVGVFASNANGGLGRVTFDASPALSGSVTLQAAGLGLELPAGFSASTGVVSLLATQITLGGPATAAAGSVQVVVGGPTPGTPITLGNSGAPTGLHLDAAEIGRFASGFARLTFGRADGSGNVIIASALTFNDPVLLRAPVSPGRILVNAAITALDGIEFQGSGATVVLNADVRTAGAPVLFNDGVLIASPSITIDTTNNNAVPAGAAITFAPGFTLNSEAGEANALTLRGGTSGVTTLGGAVGAAPGGALGTLSTDAGGSTIIGGGIVNVVNAALFGDGVAFIAHGEVRASLGVVTFASAFAASTFHAIVSGAEIDFLGPVSGTGRIRLEPNIASRDINLAHNTEGAGDALDLTKNELDRFAPGFEVIEIGKDDGSATLDLQEYAFTSPIFLQMPALGGAIVVNGDLACETDGGAIGIRGTGSTTHLRGSISTRGGPITIDDSLLIETADAFISTRRAERAGAPVSITGVINSLPLALRDLTISSGVGAITLLGEVGGATNGELGSLTLNGDGGINLFSPRIRTRGAQSYNGPVTLGPAITLQNVNSPITFNGTVNGAGNLTIAPGSGATSFNGAVGGSTQLNALLINAGSTRIFNAPVSVGVLTVFGGTVEFNRDASIGTGLLIAGTLGGSGNVTFSLPLTWVGGSMTGTGTTTIDQSGALVISGGPKTLSRAIINAGVIYWTDGDLTFSNGSLTNLPTGQFFAQSAGQFIGATGVNTLTNQGLIERSGAGVSAFTNLTLSNTGQITLASGGLSVTPAGGSFIDAGTTTIAAGSTLLVTGNYTQTAGARLNTTIAGPAAFGRVTATGTATLAGTLAVSLQDGFLPQPGQRFDVVTAATRTGTFATTLLPAPPGRFLDVQYGDTFASVVVRSGADFNGDGSIDPDDLADFIAGFFSNPADPRTDFNGDGVIDPDDLADFIAAFFGG